MAIEQQSVRTLNLYRALTVSAEGTFVSGPLLHYAYDWLDTVTFGIESAWTDTMLQVVIDILLMDSIFTATLMVTSALLQGHTVARVLTELRYDYVSADRAAWISSLAMAPLQVCNFELVPVEFGVLITNLQDIVWNAAISYMAHWKR